MPTPRTNRGGLTYQQWKAAVFYPSYLSGKTPRKVDESDLRKAWNRGECPSDWAVYVSNQEQK